LNFVIVSLHVVKGDGVCIVVREVLWREKSPFCRR